MFQDTFFPTFSHRLYILECIKQKKIPVILLFKASYSVAGSAEYR